MTTKLNTNQLGSDQTVWNESNLIAGTNILFSKVEHPVIDEHTVSLFHFNDNLTDEITGSSSVLQDAFTSASTSYDADGKFGKCIKVNASGGVKNSSLQYNSYTTDFWVKFEEGTRGGIDAFNGWPKISLSFTSSNEYELKVIPMGDNSWTSVATGSVSYTDWKHIAFCGSGYNTYIFINGKLIYTLNDTRTNQEEFSVNTKLQFNTTGSSSTEIYVDELRLSDTPRWTADFTPNDEPYLAAGEVADTYQVTNKLKAGTNVSIANDGTISSTDTTYTAGSGITITGTTIAAKAPQAALMTGYTGVTGSTLTSTASGTITRVYKNGSLLTVTTDYTVAGNVITFTTALESTDRVSVETEGGITKIIQIAQSDYDALETASALDANAFYLVVADPTV